MSLTPHSIFSTEHLVASERYAAWKESISVIFECEYEAEQGSQPFEARLEALQFDQSLLVMVDSSESDYRRRSASIRMDGLDAILIQLFIKGGVQFCSGKKVTYGKAGDLIVFDLNQEIQNHNTCFQHLTILIPGQMISPLVPNIEHWHGRVLPRDRPTTSLLRSHLLTLLKVVRKFRLAVEVPSNQLR